MYYKNTYKELNEIQRGFLYKRDSNYIEACLDLFNTSYDIRQTSLEYTTRKKFHKDVKRLLTKFGVSEININKLIHLLHEDINRVDLYVNVKGFEKGFYDYTVINALESLALDRMGINELYELKYLYEYETNDEEVMELKGMAYKKIKYSDQITNEHKRLVQVFSKNKIRPMVMGLNDLLDTQLILIDGEIKDEQCDLNSEQLREIYVNTKILLFKYVERAFFAAYWKSINQRVLSRYK
ncbi:MAG: hypothetical protein Q4Q17_02945 [Tissierellia bacterium]|nr:hypothetical protein [Tissierellia bacterium]